MKKHLRHRVLRCFFLFQKATPELKQGRHQADTRDQVKNRHEAGKKDHGFAQPG